MGRPRVADDILAACQLKCEEGEGIMRFVITCRIPVERGNELAKAGSLGSTIQSVLEELQPEAAYFADIEDARGGYIVVNMDDAAQNPAMAEPLSSR
jgi:hypothetical protein